MDSISTMFGSVGVIVGVGLLFFFYSYKNSVKLFSWIEDQTYGTRDYIMSKCELLFIEVDPKKITLILVAITVGNFVLFFGLFALFGKFLLGLIVGSLLAFIGWKIPRPFMDYLVERRIKAYENQMVDAMGLLSNGLRAGLSLPQALGMVVDELPVPISQEFNLILQENKIGVALEECFENLIKRVPTQDNQMFVTSVNILRESGGNLAEVFDTIVNVVRERIRLKQKVDTYTAQGMFQGMAIGAMPLLLLVMFGAMDPNSITPLFTHPIGIIALVVAMGLNATGIFFIFKIVKIKM